MIKIDLKRILIDKGIDNPNQFLRKHGFSSLLASRLVRDQIINVNFNIMERLCLALHCTPNDLLTWYNPSNSQFYKDHPLQQLSAARKTTNSLQHMKHIKELLLKDPQVVEQFLDNLKSNENK